VLSGWLLPRNEDEDEEEEQEEKKKEQSKKYISTISVYEKQKKKRSKVAMPAIRLMYVSATMMDEDRNEKRRTTIIIGSLFPSTHLSFLFRAYMCVALSLSLSLSFFL
jgi:hypothetical protein